jgi:ATP-dependent protease ClpP protease subunit
MKRRGEERMSDYAINELIESLVESKKDNYDFTDIVDLYNGLDRHLHLGAIDNDVADAIDNFIRFFNREDEENKIPVEKRKPIRIYVDSVGGDIMGTLTIIDSIRQS